MNGFPLFLIAPSFTTPLSKGSKIGKGRNKGKPVEIFLSSIPNGQNSEKGKISKYATRKLIAIAT